jgi:hypothetical protein
VNLNEPVRTPTPTDLAEEWEDGYLLRDQSAHDDLVMAYSFLENYGDHHEWCPEWTLARKGEPHSVDCQCGYLDALGHRPTGARSKTAALHLLIAAERGRLGDATAELTALYRAAGTPAP